MLPYGLDRNPFPGTEGALNASVFGGRARLEARSKLLSILEDSHQLVMLGEPNKLAFPLILIGGAPGTGKTHLALHAMQVAKASVSYIDGSLLSKSDYWQSIAGAFVRGLGPSYFELLRRAIVAYLLDKAERNIGSSRKVFSFDFTDVMAGYRLVDKANLVLAGELRANGQAAAEALARDLDPLSLGIALQVLEQKGIAMDAQTEQDALPIIRAISSLNARFLKKETLIEIDGFNGEPETVHLVQEILGSADDIVVALISSMPYQALAESCGSLGQTFEKAARIDMPPADFDEVVGVVLEYIRSSQVKSAAFEGGHEGDLVAKLKVVYDEFPELRSIGSMLNIMHHAFLNAAERGAAEIDEHAIDETMKAIHPAMRISESLMQIPLSEFIRIKRSCSDGHVLETGIRTAIRDLVTYSHQAGMVARPVWSDGRGSEVDVIYSDNGGTKVAVAVVINRENSSQQISNTLSATQFVDKVVILTDSAENVDSGSVVNMDRRKMIDLIYFSNKYKNNEIRAHDSDRAVMLAKSMRLI